MRSPITGEAAGYVVTGGSGRIAGNAGSPECMNCIKPGGNCSNSGYVAVDCAAP